MYPGPASGSAPVKEKELRIALVCYGGVSLAVYMHGVTKELWKLVKASQRHHAPRHAGGEAADTETVYADLLARIGETLSLRVLIDTVAGASAGGINGVLLARGLAHDLPLECLTDLWLENTDVTRLLNPDKMATRWSKWFLHPVLWLILRRFGHLADDAETRAKLSLFVRSRWFEPPFSGDRLAEFLLEAAEGMGPARHPAASLLPAGLPLTLAVTVTDYHGFRQTIPAHAPPRIEEREHRHVLNFAYRRGADGRVESDFGDDALPGLIFAARATASFPGAFPPAQLSQMDALVDRRGSAWPTRDRFVHRNFKAHRDAGLKPESASFIDGSVLNNKPFAEALAALEGRPAYREVDRRIVYIDPNPTPPPAPGHQPPPPGFFRTIKGALSDIPRNEPVRDELAAIAVTNQRVDRLRAVLEAARPRVRALVEEVLDGDIPDAPTAAQVRSWREAAGTRAAQAAGFAYEAYVRLKIDGVLDRLARLLSRVTEVQPEGPRGQRLREGLTAWAAARRVVPEWLDTPGLTADGKMPAWVGFLRDFDAGFRARRLRFVIREVNRLYEMAGQGVYADTTHQGLDDFKTTLYDALEELRALETGAALSDADRAAVVAAMAPALDPPHAVPSVDAYDRALGVLAAALGMEQRSREMDEVFALMGLAWLGVTARSELFLAYLGFGFWDVLTFSTSGWRELDEFNHIKVDRISPTDSRMLRSAGAPTSLRGARFNMFGGFFSRADREHDYLLGRLHAAERAIDMVVDAAGADAIPPAEARAFKLRAFRAILEAETVRLGADSGAIRRAEAWIADCEATAGLGRAVMQAAD